MDMTREEFFKIVPARQFFTRYCTGITNYYHKLRGFDGNKQPIDFTDEEKKQMQKCAAKLSKDLANVKF
jgi:hypothetical protein